MTATRTETLTWHYRLAMRNVAAAVSVVTTFDEDDHPYGTTVSAFTPLSMDPPLLLISLDNTSRLLRLARTGQRLGVSVLGSDQADLGRQFSRREGDRWAGVAWERVAQAPALMERHAFVGVTVEQQVEAGDHTLLIGRVTRAEWEYGLPLTYWQRAFGTHQDL